jgi:hypothetical protein
MHPRTNYGHLVATVEIFAGMCFVAVMTGPVFARFSRPRARFVFATQVGIAGHEGQQALMIPPQTLGMTRSRERVRGFGSSASSAPGKGTTYVAFTN